MSRKRSVLNRRNICASREPSIKGGRNGGVDSAGPLPKRGKMALDIYIIRIYRRDESEPGMIVGIVEDIGTDLKQRFSSFEELKKILFPTEGRIPRKMKDGPRGKGNIGDVC